MGLNTNLIANYFHPTAGSQWTIGKRNSFGAHINLQDFFLELDKTESSVDVAVIVAVLVVIVIV